MSGGAIKKLRKAKIKEGLKNNKTTKVLSEALVDMKEMTDEEIFEIGRTMIENLQNINGDIHTLLQSLPLVEPFNKRPAVVMKLREVFDNE